jgi:hypothetical protein
MFLYGYQVTENNRSLDFKANPLDSSPRLATLRLGYYSLTSLCVEIARALAELDPTHVYTATADRTQAGGLENRITITSSHTFFQILFATGPRASSSCAALIGFNAADYVSATSYQGSFTTGVRLITERPGYNYSHPDESNSIFGSVNVSASGLKEAIVFAIQSFWSVEFKYEPRQKTRTEWKNFMQWAIQQRRLEFTPEITSPTEFFEGTLESTSAEGKGLGYKMTQMLPNFPDFYQTGSLKFRKGN